MPEVMVSICCTVYNHERYIRQCLDGFVSQETEFPYEILVHDDASTDRSAEIIREYEEKYPKVMRPIYQVENQYSMRYNEAQERTNALGGVHYAHQYCSNIKRY